MRFRGGAVVGGLASVFYGTQILSSIARNGQRDHQDIMAAGLTTGGVFGLLSTILLALDAGDGSHVTAHRMVHDVSNIHCTLLMVQAAFSGYELNSRMRYLQCRDQLLCG